MSDCRLDALGAMPWPDMQQAVPSGLTWMWIGLDGLGVGALPTEEPIGTHVWGWSADTWIRARIDRHTARVAELTTRSESAGEVTPVITDRGLPWLDNESRLSNAGKASMQQLGGLGTPYMLTAGVTAPITFLHYGSAPAGLRVRTDD